jgi:hypothetical protein
LAAGEGPGCTRSRLCATCGLQKSACPVTCGDGHGQSYGIIIIRVPASAPPHLRAALRLAGPARPVIGIQERRVLGAATRGRRAAPRQSPAPDTIYNDLGADYYKPRVDASQRARSHVMAIERLGYKVTIEPADPQDNDGTRTSRPPRAGDPQRQATPGQLSGFCGSGGASCRSQGQPCTPN